MLELEHDQTIGPMQVWNILEDGELIGGMFLRNEGDTLVISNIGTTEDEGRQMPFGPVRIREILKLLKREFPRAMQVTGFRVSGARAERPEMVVRRI